MKWENMRKIEKIRFGFGKKISASIFKKISVSDLGFSSR